MRTTINASEGHVLTDGDVYGETIHLAEGMDASAFHEITDEEYNAIIAANMSDELVLDSPVSPDEATAEDYRAALAKWGVDA